MLATTTDSEVEYLTGVEIVEEEKPATAESDSTPMGWETFVGQKAFGWIAVVLFIFASAFFLRYAYQNNWIGPLGRVAIAEIVGVGLMVAGWKNYLKGWKRFSGMLNSVGTVVLYLATYSAFGFYGLLPQQHAGLFLAVIVIESMLIAILYDSSGCGCGSCRRIAHTHSPRVVD